MSMESPSCMSDSLLAMAMAACLQQRQRTASYRGNVSSHSGCCRTDL